MGWVELEGSGYAVFTHDSRTSHDSRIMQSSSTRNEKMEGRKDVSEWVDE